MVRVFNTCFEELGGRPDTKGGLYPVKMLPATWNSTWSAPTRCSPCQIEFPATISV